MDYWINNSDEILDIWLRPFEALSVPQFNEYIQVLEFPHKPSDNLRNLAKDFVLCIELSAKRLVPEQPSQMLLDRNNHEDPIAIIWENMHRQLQYLGDADTVYDWVTHTHEKIIGKQNPILGGSPWDDLLMDWVIDFRNPAFARLDLPAKIVTDLHRILLKADVKMIRFDRENHFIWHDSIRENTWEHYAVKNLCVDLWIKNQAHFLFNVTKWKQIFALLSDKELSVLDVWGQAHFAKTTLGEQPSLLQYRV